MGQVQTNVEQISNFDMKHKTIICLRVGRQSNMSTIAHFKRRFSPQGLSNIKFNIKKYRQKMRERQGETERRESKERDRQRMKHMEIAI